MRFQFRTLNAWPYHNFLIAPHRVLIPFGPSLSIDSAAASVSSEIRRVAGSVAEPQKLA